MLDKQIIEFASLADYLGPFCRLSELKNLLESVSAEVRETPLYHYLHGLYDARCFFDNSHQNDLAKKAME